ncbi:hypothetical protein [Bradyrhizobium sp. ORS 86]|uniref:hypothetical protein n=1 Tax=Bradyrhizobium sp. ORS 86 TaxID=1685970 RepID=UPI00388EA747
MNRANPYTQRMIERAIKAARACGLQVVGVKPDGTVLTAEKSPPLAETSLTNGPPLRDAREKLPCT